MKEFKINLKPVELVVEKPFYICYNRGDLVEICRSVNYVNDNIPTKELVYNVKPLWEGTHYGIFLETVKLHNNDFPLVKVFIGDKERIVELYKIRPVVV